MLKYITLAILGLLVGVAAVVAKAPLDAINAISPTHGYVISKQLAYGPDPRHKLDVYAPVGARKVPVVLFFYGGSWNSGKRSDYAFVGEALASRGIVAVLADYRLYPQVRYPGFLEDAARSVAWTVHEIGGFGGDPTRLYLMGHSAGAYNAAMLALDARWLAPHGLTPAILSGWIGLAGPYDFLPVHNPEVRPVFNFPDSPPESQPINHVSKDAPPTLLIAAETDSLVDPIRNSGGLARRLRAVGVPVKEVYLERSSHAGLIASMAWPLRRIAPVLNLVDEFVRTDAGRMPVPEEAAQRKWQ